MPKTSAKKNDMCEVNHHFADTNDLRTHIVEGGCGPSSFNSVAARRAVLGDGFYQQQFHAPGVAEAEVNVRRHVRRLSALVALSSGLFLALVGGCSLGPRPLTSARGNSAVPKIDNEPLPHAMTPEHERQAAVDSARPRLAFGLSAAQHPQDTTQGFKALVRGFIATRFDYDQHDMGGSEPLFPPPVPLRKTLRASANQSQLGFGMEAPPIKGFRNRVYVEIDFLSSAAPGADRVFNRSPRLRQAFWWLGWNEDRDALQVGQTYLLFADLLPNLTYDNLALTLGALTSREPQVRYTHLQPLSDSSALTIGVSVNAPNSGLYGENTGTAERSGLPSVHGRLGYSYTGWGGVSYFGFENLVPSPLEIAASGFIGAEMADRLAGDTSRVVADGVAVNAIVPIVGIRENKRRAGALGIIAQGWIGKNIDAYFGGNGQGIYETAAGNVNGIVGRGFFGGGNLFVSQNIWLGAFYSYEQNSLHDLVEDSIPFRITSGLFSGPFFGFPGVWQERDVNVTLWFNPLTSLYAGVGWDYRQASYNDGHDGRNNRISLSFFYNFCSAQAVRLTQLPWVCRTGGQSRNPGNPGKP